MQLAGALLQPGPPLFRASHVLVLHHAAHVLRANPAAQGLSRVPRVPRAGLPPRLLREWRGGAAHARPLGRLRRLRRGAVPHHHAAAQARGRGASAQGDPVRAGHRAEHPGVRRRRASVGDAEVRGQAARRALPLQPEVPGRGPGRAAGPHGAEAAHHAAGGHPGLRLPHGRRGAGLPPDPLRDREAPLPGEARAGAPREPRHARRRRRLLPPLPPRALLQLRRAALRLRADADAFREGRRHGVAAARGRGAGAGLGQGRRHRGAWGPGLAPATDGREAAARAREGRGGAGQRS
mmetsp:Transcript_61400/g.180112  ORF Transcript_61400/g.180112 Transcript_61400/m.180112 type:complete len:294 (-) Transcript_61400:1664-2545(-)